MTDERSERLRQKRLQRRRRAADEQTEWACGIEPCAFTAPTVRALITHQARDHPPHTCKVCYKTVPNGFFAIYHAFEEHSRAEYVRAYEATAEDIKQRERIKELIDEQVDVPTLLEELTDRHGEFTA